MSSFICSSTHYNTIEATTIELFYSVYNSSSCSTIGQYRFSEIVPELFQYSKKIAWNEKAAYKKISEMVDTMRELNVLCVSLQYKDHFKGELDDEIKGQLQIIKTKSKVFPVSKIALVKALRCMFYQIETEHLTELRELTQQEKQAIEFFEELVNELCYNIVTNTSEYDSAKWEIY